MSTTFLERFVQSPDRMRRYQQERAISEAVGAICRALEEQSISRSELAKKLGKTKGWVSQLLDSDTNKTIRTVADVLAVLGLEMHVSASPIRIGRKPANSQSASSQEMPLPSGWSVWNPSVEIVGAA